MLHHKGHTACSPGGLNWVVEAAKVVEGANRVGRYGRYTRWHVSVNTRVGPAVVGCVCFCGGRSSQLWVTYPSHYDRSGLTRLYPTLKGALTHEVAWYPGECLLVPDERWDELVKRVAEASVTARAEETLEALGRQDG